MLKISSFIILAVVAITWSRVEAKPFPSKVKALGVPAPYKHAIPLSRALASHKRSAEELSEDVQDQIVKELAAAMALLTANSTEQEFLGEIFEEIVNKKWDSLDDFATALSDAYEEITGRKPDEVPDSDEE